MTSRLSDDPRELAIQLMAVEVIADLLASASPGELGQRLTEQLRELTGARTVLLIIHSGDAGEHELLQACPPRRATLFTPTELALFCARQTPGELPVRVGDLSRAHPLWAPLARAGAESLLRYHLQAEGSVIGELVFLDLPSHERIDELTGLIGILAPSIALTLRNALDRRKIEDQARKIDAHARELERRVAERTAELETARREAVAMMDQALAARAQAEKNAEELRHEIAERRQAETALHESEDRYRAMVQSTMDGFWAVDLDTRLVEVNDAYCALSGYTREQLLAMRISDLELSENSEQVREHARDIYARGWDRFETRHRRADGAALDVEISLVHLPAQQRTLVFIHDISERKRAEENRQKLEEQLRQAQKLEAVGRLAGGVAHDFNNMLGAILGNTELALIDAPAGGATAECLNEIARAAARSAELTRQLLAFARKQTVSPRSLDLNDAIEAMLKMLTRLIGENIELVWSPGRGLDRVRIDPVQVDQILANLAVNARDAIAGVGRISIETGNHTLDAAQAATRLDATAGRHVRLTVRDSGCGMDDETRARVFEPFFTTKEQGKGTGLGLATVYGIVRQNGGFIDLQTAPGRGATFHLYFPSDEAPAASPDSPGAGREIPRGTETILLVEDEAVLLKLERTQLEMLGYSVLAADDPRAALELARRRAGEFQLVLTDVIMPGMNGRELCDRIRASQPDMRCLYMSGHATSVLADSGVLDESVHLLQKPFSFEDLARKVRETLDH